MPELAAWVLSTAPFAAELPLFTASARLIPAVIRKVMVSPHGENCLRNSARALLLRQPQWRDLPGVMLSSSSEDCDRQEADLLGASGYFVKPFKSDDMAQLGEELAWIGDVKTRCGRSPIFDGCVWGCL